MKSLYKQEQKMLDEPMYPEYPSFCVDNLQMKEIDEWEIGQEYDMHIRVKMCHYDISDKDKKPNSNAHLEVVAYEI